MKFLKCAILSFVTCLAQTAGFNCPPYSTTNTNSADVDYETCSIYACGGTTIIASGCGIDSNSVGNQYLRLFSAANSQVSVSVYCGTGSFAVINYTVPSGMDCQIYSLHEGCYQDTTCGGTIDVSGASASANPTAFPSLFPSPTPTAAPTRVPSFDPSQFPSHIPTVRPSSIPTPSPTLYPTPTLHPTIAPGINAHKLFLALLNLYCVY